ncbi:hypothetical protein [Rhodopirellula sp. P2]|uniref:hypothetical protein n=1 Tax=Rhodopirellula sp. P2 TaxID=2127060 RepID=UPI002367801E|nr:hypothetical protein [Rhodopirellula sp. P2]WDQ18639.1 hypothetical protein PSR62_08870 [Rhodopirellula sp. P2]
MSIHALSLHPADPAFRPPPDFADQLRLLDFLGDEFDYFGDVRFRPGTSFFDLIRFERTHNVIELKPSADGLTELPPQGSRNFVQIELSSSDETGVTCGCNIRDPLCPVCANPLGDWGDLIGAWHDTNAQSNCPDCGHGCTIPNLNWQHVAGFARYWITIQQIYEGEAAPTDQFLDLLAGATGCEWRYLWCHL